MHLSPFLLCVIFVVVVFYVFQVRLVLDKLYENKKIASATHNIYAYRIYCEDRNTFLQDCEDDGETAAGARLLHLLQILDVQNVMVVVTRWYGGILLGPDRFKHINNSARNLLVQEGYTESPVRYSITVHESNHQIIKSSKETEGHNSHVLVLEEETTIQQQVKV
ncbi:protein IMPACT isoform X1 [Clupea harengus]|uniref:Protein IMPACT isoform X1 n=1 Tax=Clupea harengus TaxID=7950 RepID=A0A6P8G733_CLUHA|nr:protein IMPACT isoform X1 [Clupea harengus]